MDSTLKIFADWNDYPLHFLMNDVFSIKDLINFSMISKKYYILMNQKAELFFKREYPKLKDIPVPDMQSKYKTWLSLFANFVKSKVPQTIIQILEINNEEGYYIPVSSENEKIRLCKYDNNSYKIIPSFYDFRFLENGSVEKKYGSVKLMKDGYYFVPNKEFQDTCENLLFGNCERKIHCRNIKDYSQGRSVQYKEEIVEILSKFESYKLEIFGVSLYFK